MKPGELKRGFKSVQQRLKSSIGITKSVQSCNTCRSMYADSEEAEYCHNNSVTSFDVVTKDGKVISCTYWKPMWQK